MERDRIKEVIDSALQPNRVYIVAECGLGWTDMDEAIQLIGEMKKAGADAVKFQMFGEDYCDAHPLGDKLRPYILNIEKLKVLQKEAKRKDIDFFVTPYGRKEVLELETIDVPRYKVRHKDATNLSLLKEIQKTGKEVWISVANNTVDWEFVNAYSRKVKLLYTTPDYPTPDENLYLAHRFEQAYIPSIQYAGYSDHTVGHIACLVAVSRKAKIIEKHVMLRDDPKYIDRAVSITPEEFAVMVKEIRRIEKIL